MAVLRLGDSAYGVKIRQDLERLLARRVAIGAVYTTLARLEDKGYVSSFIGDPTPERGGRAKRYFRVTPAGVRALAMTRTALTNLWSGIPLVEGRRS